MPLHGEGARSREAPEVIAATGGRTAASVAAGGHGITALDWTHLTSHASTLDPGLTRLAAGAPDAPNTPHTASELVSAEMGRMR